MSLRAVWVQPLPGNGPDSVLFSRVFSTVERRAKIYSGDIENYVRVPEEGVLYDAVLNVLGLKHPYEVFIEKRDSCDKEQQTPIFELTTKEGKLWPVFIIEKFGLLYCCLPLVEQGCQARPPLIEIPGISVGFSLLLCMAEFLGSLPKGADQNHRRLQDLHTYLSQAAPFGTPLDINPTTVRATLTSKPSAQVSTHNKQPAWKPSTVKTKPQLYVTVSEHARAVMYGNPQLQDVCNVYGSISCKAELEGIIPEVTLNLSVPQDSPPIDNLIVHPCVQAADTQFVNTGYKSNASLTQRKVRFTPPSEMFILCHYTMSDADTNQSLPITASYQMKGNEQEANLMIKVKLNKRVRNWFEYCEVQLPFYNRGPVSDIDATPSHGTVILSSDRRRVGWDIGQRFPSKTLEVTLQAKIRFAEANRKHDTSVYEDPFCHGINAYLLIYFKIADYTNSGCTVDQRSVQIHTGGKAKVTSGRPKRILFRFTSR
ncbi:AP-5 complex subunit mu-1-like isoform X2 [Amphiura filiformis]|uniref:AP-5 complex subunit mu-1-like isoform X2 n=1 Tax=Amphiura filiformis TaxID=82378 RepID=UPI003B21B61E